MPFQIRATEMTGVMLIEPQIFPDERGFFMELFKHSAFAREGISCDFVQGNFSRSLQGVLRGLHYQLPPHAQAKLVSVVEGRVWDVAVDMRSHSPTFGRWVAVELSEHNHSMLFIPAGFAHGFVTLSRDARLFYLCTSEYSREDEAGVRWDDPDLAIAWPIVPQQVSAKDGGLPLLKDARRFAPEAAQ